MLQVPVLDDEESVLHVLKNCLVDFGIEILPFKRAADFHTAVLVSFNEGTPYEVVIMDYCIGGEIPPGRGSPFSTEEMVRTLRMVDPGLKIVLISGFNPPPHLVGLVHLSLEKSVICDDWGGFARQVRELAGFSETVGTAVLS